MLEQPQPQPSSQTPATVPPPAVLLAMLEAREREADQRLAQDLAERRSLFAQRDALAARLARITDLDEAARAISGDLRHALGVKSVHIAVVVGGSFLQVVGEVGPAPLAEYGRDLLEECFIVGETLAIGPGEAVGAGIPGAATMPTDATFKAIPIFLPRAAKAKFDDPPMPLGAILLVGNVRHERASWVEPLVAFAAEALADGMRYNRMASLIRDALIALVNTIEDRDAGLVGRSSRVAELSGRLAMQRGLGASMVDRAKLLGWLHAMDPLAIREAFGTVRRGRDTAVAWQRALAEDQRGPVYGSALEDFHATLALVPAVAWRWDGAVGGGGMYAARPGRAPGREAIPVIARLVAVAAAFDRGRGLGRAAALAAVERAGGAAFEPQTVAALSALITPRSLRVV